MAILNKGNILHEYLKKNYSIIGIPRFSYIVYAIPI